MLCTYILLYRLMRMSERSLHSFAFVCYYWLVKLCCCWVLCNCFFIFCWFLSLLIALSICFFFVNLCCCWFPCCLFSGLVIYCFKDTLLVCFLDCVDDDCFLEFYCFVDIFADELFLTVCVVFCCLNSCYIRDIIMEKIMVCAYVMLLVYIIKVALSLWVNCNENLELA
jgi:hypothetical protein